MMTKKKISFDDGFVALVDNMGNDLSVVNAARASFGKRKEVLDESDIKLIDYLAEHKHMSPFRHVQFQFVIETSEVVMRQAYKHNVGASWISFDVRESDTVWNEASGRYIVFAEDNFHIPEKFRKQHKSNKQASLPDEIIDENDKALELYKQHIESSYKTYKELLDLGVCKEQARMVLPVSFKSTVQWTASLEAVVNFIKLRDKEEAQLEIRKMAIAMKELVSEICPVSVEALLKNM